MSKYYKADVLIERLENLCDVMHTIDLDKECGVTSALELIENLPTIEVSEDCISREWLVDNAEFFSQYDKNMWVVPLSKFADAPSVIPQPKEGEWIKDNLGTVICSECKRPRRDSRINHTKFCNSCGVKMKG